MELTKENLETKRAEIDTQITQLMSARQQAVGAVQNIEVQLIKLQGQKELLDGLVKSLEGASAPT
jgi:hypothetical protein